MLLKYFLLIITNNNNYKLLAINIILLTDFELLFSYSEIIV